MLLAVDCGNTHLCLGIFQGEALLRSWRLSTDPNKTEDEYLALLSQLFSQQGYDLSQLHGMILSSVVPSINIIWRKLAEKYLKCRLLTVGPETETGIKILLDNPGEVGADRIVNAVAAYTKYGGKLIVVDFGTATTFDCVTERGEYLGGAICPGIEITQRALFSYAAKLANVELQRPPAVIGRNTADALRSGLLWGYGGQTDALVRRIRQELGEDARVVATGGLASFIRNFSETIDIVDSQLTLDGLRLIWQRQQGRA